MCQSTAYSGYCAQPGQHQEYGSYYVIDISLAELKDSRHYDEPAKHPHHDDKQQHQIPVGQHCACKYGNHLASAFIAELIQHLERAAASRVGVIHGVNEVGHDSGRCHYNQNDLGKLVVPEPLLKVERKQVQHHINGADIHYSGSVKHQRSLEHRPEHTVHGALQ